MTDGRTYQKSARARHRYALVSPQLWVHLPEVCLRRHQSCAERKWPCKALCFEVDPCLLLPEPLNLSHSPLKLILRLQKVTMTVHKLFWLHGSSSFLAQLRVVLVCRSENLHQSRNTPALICHTLIQINTHWLLTVLYHDRYYLW